MALHKCHVPVNIAKRTVTMIKICIISFLLLFFFFQNICKKLLFLKVEFFQIGSTMMLFSQKAVKVHDKEIGQKQGLMTS